MCFLLLHHQTREDHPLVLLANRDEYFDRPFDPPRSLDALAGIVAPRDRRAGGSWMGLNRWGLVAAITNRPDPAPDEPLTSRGALVLAALGERGAPAAVDAVQVMLAREAFAGFHLLLADGHDALVVRHTSAEAARRRPGAVLELLPGAHVLTNLHELDEVQTPLAGLPDPEEPIEATLARLECLAADEVTVLPGDHRILKRGRHRGTVCSAVLALPGDPTVPRTLRFCEGRPGEAPFVPVPLSAGSVPD